MKRIGIDCRFAATSTGLGRYSRELVTHLLQRNDAVQYVLFVQSKHEEWLRPLAAHAVVREVKSGHYSAAEQWELPRLIRKAQLDLYVALHFNVPFFCPVPFVVTIHDLILHRYPNQASAVKQMAYKILMYRAVRRARHIIAVSEFTKQELAYFYGKYAAQRTTVIYEGVADMFHRPAASVMEAVRQKYSLFKPFFLYVGNAKQHKNVPMLLEAFKKAETRGRELILVTGGKEAASLHLPPGARFLSSISDVDLPALYALADACVTASLYEGFGLPVVEAEAVGCPVIASARASIPEVASDTALLVEPTTEAFIAALSKKSFSAPAPRPWKWDETAAKTAEIVGA
ncbi:MAG: hypothetical protein JWM56_120 [Candidatus Peribacteria bacterium]|nr:hypothetical protein [Candidatus Peribacteria bacterium]